MLETLSVSHDVPPTFAHSAPWAGLRTSPKLHRLHFDTIGGATIVVGGEWSTFPWSQLTHIHVGQCSAHDCFQILSGAWTAVACRFVVPRVQRSVSTSLQHHRPVSHSGLETLKIVASDDLCPLWSCLALPLLSTLKIETDIP
jgi:hypothetical protein